MSYLLALLSGLLLALMIYFNGLLSDSTTFYFGSVLFHTTGLLIFSMALLFERHRKKASLGDDFKHGMLPLVLPGILGAFTIILTNVVLINIGVTLLVGISLLGQVAMSMVIDTHGLLGKKKTPVRWFQLSGTAMMLMGIWLLLG